MARRGYIQDRIVIAVTAEMRQPGRCDKLAQLLELTASCTSAV